MFRSWYFIVIALGHLFSANMQAQSYSFSSTYQQWIDPDNHFVDYFTVDGTDQARVIFIGSKSFALTGGGRPESDRPTVSEGMGYGLLLAYANNDQITFDKFLNYVLHIANSYGCSTFSAQTNTCLAPCTFLMPWVINNQGLPYWYLPNAGGTAYFSSGSASDADIQIAWAIQLASQRVQEGDWEPSTFATVNGTLTYQQVFEAMADQIRLTDIDQTTLIYTPGNQWGNQTGQTGTTVMFPGYFTPQAFMALAQAPLLDVSNTCPDTFPIQSPANSLQLVFKSNVVQTLSIDYLGSGDNNVTITVDSNFVPKPGIPNGYTVAPLVKATAIISSSTPNDTNASFIATVYNEQGQATIKSNYFFEFKNNVWTVSDQGSSPGPISKFCQSQSPSRNVVEVFLTQPGIENVNFKFTDVLNTSATTIAKFQQNYLRLYKNSLLPNVIHYNGNIPSNGFDNVFGYDSCRYALWAGAFLQSDPDYMISPIRQILQSLLISEESNSSGVVNFINNQTLPSGGIDVLTNQAIGNWDKPAIPLNATVMTGAAILGGEYQKIYDALSPPVLAYRIIDNQPSLNDPQGDSEPYYNAVMVLLSEAILNKKPPFGTSL